MINKLEDAEVVLNQGDVIGKKLATLSNLEYVHLALKGECKVEKHALPMNVDFFVISGSACLEIDSESYDLNTGDLLRVPKGRLRGLVSKEGQEIKLLVIKSIV